MNNLTLNTSVTTATSRDEYSTASHSLFTAAVGYAVGGGPQSKPMPGWWSRAFDGLPSWLATTEFAQAMKHAQLHTDPATFRLSSNYSKGDDRRSSFTKPAASVTDTATIVSSLANFWRNATALELRPFDALSARWEFSSLRDLRHYGDSTLAGIAATSERSNFLGLNGGLERERTVNTALNFTPQLKGWLRPRFDFSAGYSMLRDPNTTQLLHAGDSTAAYRLPATPQRAAVAQHGRRS